MMFSTFPCSKKKETKNVACSNLTEEMTSWKRRLMLGESRL
uniref:Uncharacterized protein n=1 Tax=Arundo donax TaxID=35708 RepID=A0A0A9B2A0_ARUDO